MKPNQEIPQLTEQEMKTVETLRSMYPREFHSNQLDYVRSMFVNTVKNQQVFRASIMGQTRMGKSEVGSTLAFWYINCFNHFFEHGAFDNLDLFRDNILKGQKLSFTSENVLSNQMEYKKKIKEKYSKNEMVYGQIWQIDESKKSIGGMGSISENLEMTNLNNITAKFNQSEIWIKPTGLEAKNTTIGLYTKKKDIENRVNWCLVYIPVAEPNGMVLFKFIGWADIPLHDNEEFRLQYNEKKNEWIGNEFMGKVDPRDEERGKAAKKFYDECPKAFEVNDKGKFLISRDKRLVHLKRMIREGLIMNFNEVEQMYIVQEAEVIAEDAKQEQ